MTGSLCVFCNDKIPEERGKGQKEVKYCSKQCSSKQWNMNNLKRKREHNKKYYTENKEIVNTKNKKYRDENPEKIKEYQSTEAYKTRYQEYNINHKEERKEHYINHREEKIEASRKYYYENREEILEQQKTEEYKAQRRVKRSTPEAVAKAREYRENHKEHERKMGKIWRVNNPHKGAEVASKRRAIKLNQMGNVSPNIKETLLEAQNFLCLACQKTLEDSSDIHLDHIMPLKLGGLHDDENLQILCRSCNCHKSSKHPDVWEKEQKQLILA